MRRTEDTKGGCGCEVQAVLCAGPLVGFFFRHGFVMVVSEEDYAEIIAEI